MSKEKKAQILVMAIGILYLVLPDLIPGPIDDGVVLAVCAGITRFIEAKNKVKG